MKRFSTIKVTFVVILFLAQFLYAVDPCSGYFMAWKNNEPRYLSKKGKKVRLDSTYEESHHLLLVNVDSTASLKISMLPAFVSKQTKDTSYSASDGGFIYGKGSCSSSDSSMAFNGNYTKAAYAHIDDSTFEFSMRKTKGGFRDSKAKLVFKRIDENAYFAQLEKWGFGRPKKK